MSEKDTICGVIIKGVGGLYGVRPVADSGADLISCRARGVFRHENITPLPGDLVVLVKDGESSDYVIDEIKDRRNSLIRPAMANLSHLFIVIPAAKPKPDLVTADKLICIAEGKEVEPVIVITKSELDIDEAEGMAQVYRKSGFSVFCVSAATGSGTAELRSYIRDNSKGMIAAFAGASGAGKSTLMSCLFPGISLKTGEISRKTQRGKHTTRHAELYPFDTGVGVCLIADTPGFSILDFTHYNFLSPEQLPYTFREFSNLIGNCRYTKCTHTKEEGCAVLEAIKNGSITKARHDSYIQILSEIKKKPDWQRRREERV